MEITLSPKDVSRKLSWFIVLLLIAHITVVTISLVTGHDTIHGLIPLFHFGSESNIPTLYSSITLLACSALLWTITKSHKKQNQPYRYWLGLAVLFLFLSVDETASLHERSGEPIRAMMGTSGLLYYGWMIPYGAAVLLFITLYVRFLMQLPRQTAQMFVLAGTLYVAGAIGFEMLGGWWHELHGTHNITYYLFVTLEELFEMFGCVIFIHTLLSYICDEFKVVTTIMKEG